jgi:3-dehydroquinate dehydratase II
MKSKIMLLNGPNLNLLGVRQPHIYGSTTLADIETRLLQRAKLLRIGLEFRQSNYEGELIDWVHEARASCMGLIINPAGLTHTSVALMDALLTCEFPVIELHLSNPHKREGFRHLSYTSFVATGTIAGFGARGYEMAFEALAEMIAESADPPK